jgi:hypothetical protein
MKMDTVVVTGAAGYIAAQLLPVLAERYELRLLDVQDRDRDGTVVPGINIVQLDDPDLDTYREHFRGADAVVHLAYNKGQSGGFKHRSYEQERVNLDMAQHVYQLAMEEGIRRVVVASSNHAADWYEHQIRARELEMLGPEAPRLSDNWYGWAKAAYELMGFLYATGSQGSVVENVQLRIGAPRPIRWADFAPDDRVGYKRNLGAYISLRDLGQICVKSLETDDIRNERGIPFQAFYGVSDNARAFWSLENARKVIGYAPRDDSEVEFAAEIRAALIEPASTGRL